MYHTAIIKAVLDRPEDIDDGISAVVLDDSHTLVLASDREDRNPSITKERLDDFVADFETIDSHSGTANVTAWLGPEDSPKDSYNKS